MIAAATEASRRGRGPS